jgi:hypothetical protein
MAQMAVQKMHVIVQKKQVAFVDNGPQYQTGRCVSDNEKYLSIPPRAYQPQTAHGVDEGYGCRMGGS